MTDPRSTFRGTVVRHVAETRERGVDLVAVEAALEVRIAGEPFAVIMQTPGDERALVAGFLFSEGIVTSRADLIDLRVANDAPAVEVVLAPGAAARVAASPASRAVAMNASCGMCGRPSLASIEIDAPPVRQTWTVAADCLRLLPDRLLAAQATFADTGGLHAASLATPAGDLVDVAEDVGRHNAVDKVVGRALLDDRLPLAEALLFVSGRTSFEIVQKAWLAGIPLVASVSAPSSLAIDLAGRAGITLIGFLRGERFNVYTGDERIAEAAPCGSPVDR